jgi:hypothetical protein
MKSVVETSNVCEYDLSSFAQHLEALVTEFGNRFSQFSTLEPVTVFKQTGREENLLQCNFVNHAIYVKSHEIGEKPVSELCSLFFSVIFLKLNIKNIKNFFCARVCVCVRMCVCVCDS